MGQRFQKKRVNCLPGSSHRVVAHGTQRLPLCCSHGLGRSQSDRANRSPIHRTFHEKVTPRGISKTPSKPSKLLRRTRNSSSVDVLTRSFPFAQATTSALGSARGAHMRGQQNVQAFFSCLRPQYPLRIKCPSDAGCTPWLSSGWTNNPCRVGIWLWC